MIFFIGTLRMQCISFVLVATIGCFEPLGFVHAMQCNAMQCNAMQCNSFQSGMVTQTERMMK